MTTSVKKFFSEEEQEAIVSAITRAEKNTSGEIRIHLEAKSNLDPVSRARQIFTKLKLHKTKARNGILFYLATDDHKFAVIGDSGIDAVVSQGFWENIKNKVLEKFKQGNFAEGLIQGIIEAGNSLQEYFPYKADDENEHKDEISFG